MNDPFDDPATDDEAPQVLPESAVGRALTLSDIFRVDGDWRESRYDVSDRTEIQGMGATIDKCGDYGAAELELRLARNFSSLDFNVGQANDSPSSDDLLVVEVVANGSQLDIREVPFDRIQDFSDLDVEDVNALKIRLWLDRENCRYGEGVIAVIEDMTLQ